MKKLRAGFTPEAARLIAKLPPDVKKLVRSSIDKLLTTPNAGAELVAELLDTVRSKQGGTGSFIASMRRKVFWKFIW